MIIVPWKTQQIPQTYLLMNSKYPWKLLAVMHLVSMETEKDKIES